MLFNCGVGRRLLRVPWTARRSNQSILKEISPGISLEGRMLKLKLQYFGHLMRRVDSLEKTLMLGEVGGRRRRGWQRMRWLDGITDSMDVSLGELRVGDGQGGLACCDSWGRKESDTTQQLNWCQLFYYVFQKCLIILSCNFINWNSSFTALTQLIQSPFSFSCSPDSVSICRCSNPGGTGQAIGNPTPWELVFLENTRRPYW